MGRFRGMYVLSRWGRIEYFDPQKLSKSFDKKSLLIIIKSQKIKKFYFFNKSIYIHIFDKAGHYFQSYTILLVDSMGPIISLYIQAMDPMY